MRDLIHCFVTSFSLTSTLTVTLGDVQEFIAVDSLVFPLVSQTFLDQALLKYIVPDVKTFTTLVPNTRAVSLIYFLFKQVHVAYNNSLLHVCLQMQFYYLLAIGWTR